MPEQEQLDAAWATFMVNQGDEIQQWVADSLEETREVFDFNDGTHIKWIDADNLGFLITLNGDEVASLLAAWDAAHEGNAIAAGWVMEQCSRMFSMLEAATNVDQDYLDQN